MIDMAGQSAQFAKKKFATGVPVNDKSSKTLHLGTQNALCSCRKVRNCLLRSGTSSSACFVEPTSFCVKLCSGLRVPLPDFAGEKSFNIGHTSCASPPILFVAIDRCVCDCTSCPAKR